VNTGTRVLRNRPPHGFTDRFERFGALRLQRGGGSNRSVENGLEEIVGTG
jgi:hypothetical protein